MGIRNFGATVGEGTEYNRDSSYRLVTKHIDSPKYKLTSGVDVTIPNNGALELFLYYDNGCTPSAGTVKAYFKDRLLETCTLTPSLGEEIVWTATQTPCH